MSETNNESNNSCVFFKAPARRPNAPANVKRRRESSSNSSSSSGDEVQPSAWDCRSTNTTKKGLVTTSKNHSSNRRQPGDNADDDNEKKISVEFKSDRKVESSGPKDMGATATVEIDADLTNDQQAIFERAKKINEELKGKADDKIYRGINNYQQFYEKRDTAQGNASSGLVRNKGKKRETHPIDRIKYVFVLSRTNSSTCTSTSFSSLGLSARYL